MIVLLFILACKFNRWSGISADTTFAYSNELNCHSTIVLDMLIDSVELIKMYANTIVKKYSW